MQLEWYYIIAMCLSYFLGRSISYWNFNSDILLSKHGELAVCGMMLCPIFIIILLFGKEI